MRIVINSCFGGFNISSQALYELVKMNSSCITKNTFQEYFGDNYKKDLKRYQRFDLDENYLIGDYGSPLIKDSIVYRFDDSKEKHRTHPDLIAIVEQLGVKANGHCAKLKIIEIPDDIKFEIKEYDGKESVHELHASWR